MAVNIGELLYALFGMVCGVIMTLGVIWTLEPTKFKELMKAIRHPKKMNGINRAHSKRLLMLGRLLLQLRQVILAIGLTYLVATFFRLNLNDSVILFMILVAIILYSRKF